MYVVISFYKDFRAELTFYFYEYAKDYALSMFADNELPYMFQIGHITIFEQTRELEVYILETE